MRFGFAVGDFLAVSQLALRVYNAYKGAPDDFSVRRNLLAIGNGHIRYRIG